MFFCATTHSVKLHPVKLLSCEFKNQMDDRWKSAKNHGKVRYLHRLRPLCREFFSSETFNAMKMINEMFYGILHCMVIGELLRQETDSMTARSSLSKISPNPTARFQFKPKKIEASGISRR
jgi:hypothetical protein